MKSPIRSYYKLLPKLLSKLHLATVQMNHNCLQISIEINNNEARGYKKQKYMEIYIKNMVSLRCKLKVEEEFNKLDLPFLKVNLGKVEMTENLDNKQFDLLKQNLALSGLELLDDKKLILVEKMSNMMIPSDMLSKSMNQQNPTFWVRD